MLLISWIDFCFPYISYAHLFLFLRAILSIWDFLFLFLTYTLAFMVTQMGKNLIQETQVQSLDWEDSPREGNGNPLQYSCLENPRDRGTWWPAVHGVAKSQTQQSDWTELNWTELCVYVDPNLLIYPFPWHFPFGNHKFDFKICVLFLFCK